MLNQIIKYSLCSVSNYHTATVTLTINEVKYAYTIFEVMI